MTTDTPKTPQEGWRDRFRDKFEFEYQYGDWFKVIGKDLEAFISTEHTRLLGGVEDKILTSFTKVIGLVYGLALDTWDDKRITMFNRKSVEIRDDLLSALSTLEEKQQ